MATNWVDEVLSGATSTGSKTLSLATGNVLSVANSSSESLFTVHRYWVLKGKRLYYF